MLLDQFRKLQEHIEVHFGPKLDKSAILCSQKANEHRDRESVQVAQLVLQIQVITVLQSIIAMVIISCLQFQVIFVVLVCCHMP